MKQVYFYTLSLKYNSIKLQTELLAKKISNIWGVSANCIHSINEAFYFASNDNNSVFITYGSYIPGLFFRKTFKNVVFIFHNITPANYFWKTQPQVAFLSLLGYVQLFLLSLRRTKWIAVSDYNKNVLEKFGHTGVMVCPNIIEDNNSFPIIDLSKKTNNPSLLFVGRIIENKDCLGLLNVVYTVASLYKGNLNLVIVGDGKENSKYFKKFNHLLSSNLFDNLHIIWKKSVSYSELLELYRMSWLYISLSKHEGFGLPVCEGVLNGVPALYTSCGGQESVLNGIGLCNIEDMPQKIIEILSDKIKWELLLNQQKDAIKPYQTPLIEKRIREVYDNYIV